MARNSTILLVDDEVNLQRTLAVILRRAGYRVLTACSADESLQIINKQTIDLMFLDINMPGKGGIELLAELSRSKPYIPVVILTAQPSQETIHQALSLGVCGYLVKPLDPASILSCIHGYLPKP
jgi:DNA-binding response OmpR family regulator